MRLPTRFKSYALVKVPTCYQRCNLNFEPRLNESCNTTERDCMGCNRKLARLRALEDAIDIARRTPIAVDYVISIERQATDFSVFKKGIDGRETMASR